MQCQEALSDLGTSSVNIQKTLAIPVVLFRSLPIIFLLFHLGVVDDQCTGSFISLWFASVVIIPLLLIMVVSRDFLRLPSIV